MNNVKLNFHKKFSGLSPLHWFQNTQEIQNTVLNAAGKIPNWLEGQLIYNGPGVVKDKKGVLSSWFDGLAKLHAFQIKDGKVTYNCKFLQSTAYKKYQQTSEFDFSGFDQQAKSGSFSLIDFLFGRKNEDITNANVNIAKINLQFIALTETPLPVEFDEDLNTIGIFNYDDSLPKNYSFESAHLLIDPDTKAAWNFLIKIGPFKTSYIIYKISPLSKKRELVASIPTSSIAYMHSFSLAGRYMVLVAYPFRAENPKDIRNGFLKAFTWDAESLSTVYIVDKNTGKWWSLSTDAFFSFHHINGFEKDGKIFIDLIAYSNADIINKVNYYPFIKHPDSTYFKLNTKLLRLEINLQDRYVKSQPQAQENIEFPRINEAFLGKTYHYFYAIDNREKGNGIIKYSLDTQEALSWFQEGCCVNEPIFVPHPDAKEEGEGVILSIVSNLTVNQSFLLVLNAKDLQELARAPVPHLIPFGFHGKFFCSGKGEM